MTHLLAFAAGVVFGLAASFMFFLYVLSANTVI